MNKKAAFVFALVVAAAPALGQQRPPFHPQVGIHVANGKIQPVNQIDIYPEEVLISWYIVDPGYTFPTDGIVVFDDKGKAANSADHACGPDPFGSGRGFLCVKAHHTPNKQFPYNIKVIDSSNSPLVLDPVIQNH